MDEAENLEDLRSAGKCFSKLGGIYLAGAILMQALAWGVRQALSRLAPGWEQNADIALLASGLCIYGAGMPFIILMMRLVPADPPGRRRIKAGSFVIAALISYGVGIISNVAGNLCTMLIGLLKGGAVQNEYISMTAGVSPWLMVAEVVVIGPILEEYVFRKLLVDRTVRYGQGVAVLLSGFMFGLFHGNLNQFAYAFTLGVFFAFLYVKTGSWKITAAIHMMINLISGVLSLWVLKVIDGEEYSLVVQSMDPVAMEEFMMSNLAGFAVLGIFALCVVGMVIAGLVLFIVALATHKFTFERGAAVIPRGKRFRTVFVNPGMVLYCVFWLGMILMQLMG